MIGEVPPDIIDAIIARALAEHAVTPSGVEVTGAEAVVWSDGSLGCPEPGTVYRQAPVAGYRVQLAADGELWDYRVGGQGWIILCDRPTGRDAISTIDP